jgi:hypothetical protein
MKTYTSIPLSDWKIRKERWVLNWKFPFLHRVVTEKTLWQIQSELNDEFNKLLEETVFVPIKKKYIKDGPKISVRAIKYWNKKERRLASLFEDYLNWLYK